MSAELAYARSRGERARLVLGVAIVMTVMGAAFAPLSAILAQEADDSASRGRGHVPASGAADPRLPSGTYDGKPVGLVEPTGVPAEIGRIRYAQMERPWGSARAGGLLPRG
ncbi:MAG: hypothetical protein JWM19_2161 [Actinomycetia bacterium]|nr:hypothetical protein [Actinomycetes bacterium]